MIIVTEKRALKKKILLLPAASCFQIFETDLASPSICADFLQIALYYYCTLKKEKANEKIK